jgi:hypothetical protein
VSARSRLLAGFVAALSAPLLAMPVAVAQTATHSHNDSQESFQHKLYRLRMCESHNNYRANTGNGYYGAYQFARGTWHSLGFKGRPDRASKRRQNEAARKLHRQQGWRPWPACSRREHLSS